MIGLRRHEVASANPAGTGAQKGCAPKMGDAVPAGGRSGAQEGYPCGLSRESGSSSYRLYGIVLLRHDAVMTQFCFVKETNHEEEHLACACAHHRRSGDARTSRRCCNPVRQRQIPCRDGMVAAAARHCHRSGAGQQGGIQLAVHRRRRRRAVHHELCPPSPHSMPSSTTV